MKAINFDAMEDAQIIGHAMDTRVNVNGQPTTIYDFLEENWKDDESNMSFLEVRQLFEMPRGGSMQIKDWHITRDEKE